MDRRSWLWRRKSSEKSPGETESSGSVSSISERFSDDQEAFRASPNNAHSPDVSSKIVAREVDETVKGLNEKLSAALFSISAKEDLVKQHIKVAEEAVAGWEKAENENATLKQQLEVGAQRNSALENRIGHLDGALKECVRQFRQSREEHEQKLHETLTKKTSEWESQKLDLETRITELEAQLEARKAEFNISIVHDLQLKIQALKNENSTLTLRAESASKQHLESIKKVAKLEAECRRLRANAKRSSPFKDNNNKNINYSVCAESITDSQSDTQSDSWASALIVELDQFKSEKVQSRNPSSSVDLMDDFLEMERLAAMPEADHVSSKENGSMAEIEALRCKMGELEEKNAKMVVEKRELEMILDETRDKLKISQGRMIELEDKLVEMQWELNSANGSKHSFEIEIESLESRNKELESKLEAKNFEVEKLSAKVGLLQKTSVEFEMKCQNIEAFALNIEQLESRKKELESQLKAKDFEIKMLREKVGLLERNSAAFETRYQNVDALTLKIENLEAQLTSTNLKVDEERAITARLKAKCENMKAIEAERIGLESKLISAQLEGGELLGRMSSLEWELKEQTVLSSELKVKVEAVQEQKEALRSQLEAAYSEAEKLRERVGILEKEVEVGKASSLDLAIKCKHLEAKREESESLLVRKVEEQRALESQLELTQLEARELYEKVMLMEKEIEKERELSAEFSGKCDNLKEEMARMKREVELQQPVSSTGELKLRQGLELTMVSGKFEECQKTIASLSQKLNLLKDFDLMFEAEELEIYDKENFDTSSIFNGQEKSLRLSSASSALPEFVNRFSPSSKSCIKIQSL